ncbi:hypothetical protein ACSTS3_19655 [Aquimarina muelleri]|uniref:hypothetical protein n=1 Tax=Aquimarina muelleri TaxID=279356 RepID=UPI003F6892BD
MTKYILFITVMLFALTGCRTAKTVLQKSVIKTDSTSIKITYQKKMDTLTVAADSLKINVPIASLTEVPIVAKSKSGRSTGSVRRVKDNIEVECFTDKYEKIIESQNKLIETLIKLTEVKEVEKTKTEFKTHWMYKALSWIGILAVVFVGGKFLLKRYLKPF